MTLLIALCVLWGGYEKVESSCVWVGGGDLEGVNDGRSREVCTSCIRIDRDDRLKISPLSTHIPRNRELQELDALDAQGLGHRHVRRVHRAGARRGCVLFESV